MRPTEERYAAIGLEPTPLATQGSLVKDLLERRDDARETSLRITSCRATDDLTGFSPVFFFCFFWGGITRPDV